MVRPTLPAALLLATACTLEAGSGFATLEAGTLEVGLDRASSRIDGDTVLTDEGQAVQLTSFVLAVSRIELQELEGSVGTGGSFDPAHPPAGFTLCHGGHCHAADGSLVSYEEIQAMLSGGSVSWRPVVTLPVDRELDVLSTERVALDVFQPSAELPQATLGRVYVALERLRLTGSVGGRSFEIDVPLGGRGFVATINRPIDRDHAAEIELNVEVAVGGRLFDDVDLGAEPIDAAPLVTYLLGTDIEVGL